MKTNFILPIVTLNSFNLHFLLCSINKTFMNNCFCIGSTNLTFFLRWIPLDILFCLFILLTFTNEALHLLVVGLNQRSHAIVCLKCPPCCRGLGRLFFINRLRNHIFFTSQGVLKCDFGLIRDKNERYSFRPQRYIHDDNLQNGYHIWWHL